jgi:uncharacterized protein (TIGR02246 family)
MKLSCLATVIVGLAIPSFADQTDRSGWQYDAAFPEHLQDAAGPTAADINAINDLLQTMLKSWNARDLGQYMSAFWRSPQLLVVSNNEQYLGWDALNASYKRSFSDSETMGKVQDTRIQIRITQPDLALARTTWTAVYPNSSTLATGNTTLNLQKLDVGWRVISSYLSYVYSTPRGWEYDSIAPDRSASSLSPEEDDLKAINDLLVKMLERWNAHDIDGYLSVLWHSPQLLVILQAEQFQGWQSIYDSYKTGFQDPNAMGSIEPSRIQIKLVKPDMASAVTWWKVTFPTSKTRVVGNTTMSLQKFAEGWKIVLAHSSFAEP